MDRPTDCFNDPHNCISERLFKQMADLVVSDGYKDVGYTYVNIDDCWLSHERDRRGRLQPDPLRFPSGIPALSKYVSYNIFLAIHFALHNLGTFLATVSS